MKTSDEVTNENNAQEEELAKQQQAEEEKTRAIEKFRRELIHKRREIEARHFFIVEGKNTGKVIQLPKELDPDGEVFTILKAGEAASAYDNKTLKHPDKKEPVHPFWYYKTFPGRLEVDKIIFEPGAPPQRRVFNADTGFAIEAKKGDCQYIKDFVLRILANEHQKHFDYQWKLLAFRAKNQRDHRRVALVYSGAMGAGKNVFADYMKKIYGVHYNYQTGLARLMGKFNASILRARKLVVVDECDWSKTEWTSLAKSMITQDRVSVEGKYVDAFTISNYASFIFLSNNEGDVPAFRGDRRFAMFAISAADVGKYDIFDRLVAERDGGGPAAALYEWLYETDLEGFDPRDIPRTQIRVKQMVLNEPSVIQFYMESLLDASVPEGLQYKYSQIGDGEWPRELIEVARSHWYKTYLDWWQLHGKSFPTEPSPAREREFGRLMKAIIPAIEHSYGQYGRQVEANNSQRKIPEIETANTRVFPLLPLPRAQEEAAKYFKVEVNELFDV